MAKRMNNIWEIMVAVPMPKKPGESICEIVIGKRPTDFQPWVTWHCFSGTSYTWGHYCQTFSEVFDCAVEKITKEAHISEATAKTVLLDAIGDRLEGGETNG